MKIEYIDNNVIVTNFSGETSFSLEETLESGQCFRFFYNEKDKLYTGIVRNLFLKIKQEEDKLTFYNIKKDDFNWLFYEYFDFSQDYETIKNLLSEDETLKKMVEYAPGIHILKQDLWEAIVSFIISANNNIKRIKGIVLRLCENFGEELEEKGNFTFPTAKRLSSLTIEDLAPLKAGFRAKYIIDAANKVVSGEVDLSLVLLMSYEEAKKYLQKIKGVGPKVADCALLFGAYKIEAFPMDVWMKRAMENYFKEGLPENAKAYSGIAQQYIFHFARTKEDSF